MALELPKLPGNQTLVDNGGKATIVFSVWWQSVVNQIKASINEIISAQEAAATAQAAADEAQNDAIDAIQDAADAQATADDAFGTASTAVQQDVGPVWADATGTVDRTAYASVGVVGPFTVSAIPTQAEVQAIADGLVLVSQRQQDISEHMVAMINDLYENKSFTN